MQCKAIVYNYVLKSKEEKTIKEPWTYHDDTQVINYISHLIEMNYDSSGHLGSKGFESISKDIREGFGC